MTLSVYRLVMFRISSCSISGCVCARGGWLVISRMIFFCVLISGCMYSLLCLCVPHIVIAPIKCGYTCM